MSELKAFLAMLDRCGIPYDESRSWNCEKNIPGDGIEIEISPCDGSQYHPDNRLTGVAWASTTYKFDASGMLIGIDMQGD
jgi:hypothetical protein